MHTITDNCEQCTNCSGSFFKKNKINLTLHKHETHEPKAKLRHALDVMPRNAQAAQRESVQTKACGSTFSLHSLDTIIFSSSKCSCLSTASQVNTENLLYSCFIAWYKTSLLDATTWLFYLAHMSDFRYFHECTLMPFFSLSLPFIPCQLAERHHNFVLLRRCTLGWQQSARESLSDKEACADQLHQHFLLRRSLSCWKSVRIHLHTHTNTHTSSGLC